MNRAQRRKLRGSHTDLVRSFLRSTVLHNAPDVPLVGVGPIVWGINPTDGRHWYFACASADTNGRFHLDCLKIATDDQDLAEQTRATLILELVNQRPLVVHDFDAEEQFAAFCAAAWPSDRTQRLFADVKADYAARADAE